LQRLTNYSYAGYKNAPLIKDQQERYSGPDNDARILGDQKGPPNAGNSDDVAEIIDGQGAPQSYAYRKIGY
jgi:hypothetical protein